MAKEKSNREFANEDTVFQACCQRVEVKPTVRQASKYRNSKGAAYKARKKGGE